jgi:hypothetical protein
VSNETEKPELSEEELEKIAGGTGDPDRPIVVGVPPNPCVGATTTTSGGDGSLDARLHFKYDIKGNKEG